jgi:FixJ family two-component response regulator
MKCVPHQSTLPGGNNKLFSGRIVTIVDDDKSIRDGLSNLLRSHGIRTYCFASAIDFLNSKHLQHCECLIADVKMPEMGGLQLLEELRRRLIRVPVIFISAYPSRSVTDRVKAGEAICFVEKPFDAKTIESCLRTAFRNEAPSSE